MKILMLASGSARSSLTFRALSFARELVQRGHEVELVSPAADKYNKFTPTGESSIDGVTLTTPRQLVTTSPIGLIPYIIGTIWQVLSSKADVIIIYKPTPITAVGLIGRLIGRPVVLDMDDLGSEVMRLEGQSGLMVRLVDISERLSAKFATRIITASSYLQRHFSQRYPNTPVSWVSNGVTPTDYHVNPPAAQPKLVYFGAMGRTNLLMPIIEALPKIIAAVPGTTMLVQGYGDARPALAARATELGLNDSVSFTGFVDMFEAPKAWNEGDIGLCYMPDENGVRAASNMKLFQYLAAGLVPFVSEVGDLPNYVGTIGITAPADDPKAVADALTLALRQPNDLKRRGHQAPAYVAARYAWSTLADELETLITTPTVAKEGELS